MLWKLRWFRWAIRHRHSTWLLNPRTSTMLCIGCGATFERPPRTRG